MRQVSIIITGRVQGVFFRQSTKETADSLGIFGWVRNNSDGTVELLLEGEKEPIDKLISWCYKGSPMSQVREVKIISDSISDTSINKSFDIRY